MKLTGIIYSPAMVQAHHAGRKTQTRRLTGLSKVNEKPDDWGLMWMSKDYGNKPAKVAVFVHLQTNESIDIPSPYGGPGDYLWTRENWNYIGSSDQVCYQTADHVDAGKWKPSIHLRMANARTWDVIEDVRPERLCSISDKDAIAEGIEPTRVIGANIQLYKDYEDDALEEPLPIRSFKSLIRSIHGPEIWQRNPWVWRIKFRNLSRTGMPQEVREIVAPSVEHSNNHS